MSIRRIAVLAGLALAVGMFLVGLWLASGATVATNAPSVMRGQDGAPMILIPGGEVTTIAEGTTGGVFDDPPRRFAVSTFWLDRYEVTNELFAAFLSAYGRDRDDGGRPMVRENPFGLRKLNGYWEAQPGYERNPVVCVTWRGASLYAGQYGKRLPTEAEWEYACRAGGKGKWCFGDDEGRLGEYAWYSANSRNRTHPVGQKKPSAWGLYDMHGNAYEWVADRESTGPRDGLYLLRGGSWKDEAAWWCECAGRPYVEVGDMRGLVGFRCAMSADKASKP